MDLVLVDLECLRAAVNAVHSSRQASPGVPILVLDHQGSSAARVAVLEAGADDCVSRPVLDREVLLRARILLAQRINRDETPHVYGEIVLEPMTLTASRAGRELGLTPTEFALLACLVETAEVPVSRSALYRRVWGADLDGDSNALTVYIGYLRRKLSRAGEPQLIHTVRNLGYMLAGSRHSNENWSAK